MAIAPVAEPLGLFKSERALVTGSASSIGRAIAIRLAHEGCEVTLADIDPVRNADTLAAITAAGGNAHALTCDLSKPGGYRDVLKALGAATPHILVHAASPPRHEADDVARVDEATWDAMTTTNVRSGFFLGRDLALAMRRDGIRGRMLYITSVHAQTPRNLPHYSVSKAGMKMVVDELARAFAPDGIRVNALAPGAVPGGGSKNTTADAFRAKIPMRRVGTPDDMAATAVALLSDRLTPYVTGTTTHVDGGLALYNWIPFSE